MSIEPPGGGLTFESREASWAETVPRSPWTNLLSWNEDHGGFRSLPGVAVNLDISSVVGQANVMFRFRYYDPNTGDWDWYVQVDDVEVSDATGAIVLSPATLPPATLGTAYSTQLSASGGTAPYSYAITSGALPAGLSLSSSGLLSGTPTAVENAGFTVTATDSSTGGGPYSGSQAYTLSVVASPPVVVGDTAFTSGDQPVTINVTSNDTGVITSVNIVQAPSHGTATVNGLSIVYTPTGAFFPTDSFTYTATGPGGTSAEATVTIRITAAAGMAVPTLGVWGLALLAGLFGLFGAIRLRFG